MRRAYSSRVRAAFIAPCAGVGGGDMLMTGLINHAHYIEWVGAAIQQEFAKVQATFVEAGWPSHVPIHCANHYFQYPFARYHRDWREATLAACKDADIIITWCVNGVVDPMNTLNIPIIEYAQNSDGYACQVVASNAHFTNYKAACSKAASRCFNSNDVKIIYNGIDPSRCTPRKGRAFQRKVWGIPDHIKVVLYMGRMVPEKHPEDLVRAITSLPEDYIGIFVGTGDKLDEIHQAVKSFCPQRIAFVKPEYHVGDFLAAADCFLLPSDFEGHPLALMEAMLAGVPCVYTDFEVMPELHESFGPLGHMIPRAADTETLCDAIIKATDTTNQDTWGYVNNARQVVWDNFTISTIASQWEEYIETCLFDYYTKRRLSLIYPGTPRKPMTSV